LRLGRWLVFCHELDNFSTTQTKKLLKFKNTKKNPDIIKKLKIIIIINRQSSGVKIK
jgi:hypothetical protein